MKVRTILALVGGRFWSEARAPKGAFDIGEARRVGAVWRWVHRRIPFEVNVEGGADIDGIAKRRACRNIVGVESMKTHVAIGAGCSLLVEKRSHISRRSRRVGGLLLQEPISQ